MAWFGNTFKKNKKEDLYHVKYEKSDAVRVFDELEDVAVRKQKLTSYKKRLEERQKELAVFETLDEEEVTRLGQWVNRYRDLLEQKQLLKGRLIKNNQALLRLSQYEEELPELMRDVVRSERQVKENERDMVYLEDERTELQEERDLLLGGYRFLKGFIVIVLIFLAGLLLFGFAMMQMLREWIWIYLSALSMAVLVMMGGALYAKEYIERALRRNELLQKKVVKYLNRTKIRYFHNKRYLEFQFDKLGVDSSAKLEMYYNRYVKNKHNETQYNQFNRQMMQIEEDINQLFKVHDIVITEMEVVEEWARMPQKANAYKRLEEEQEKNVHQLEGLDAYEEELWKEVYALKEDPKYTSMVDDLINKYMALTKDHLDNDRQNA